MSRRFTHQEAERLLPEVDRALREAQTLKRRYDEAEEGISVTVRRISMAGGSLVDRQAILDRRSARDGSAERLKEVIEEVHALGVLIKDLDTGLVDFPTLFHGEEVYLCWRLGERGIEFWHGVEEGFRGRKAIDREFLDNHEGERPN